MPINAWNIYTKYKKKAQNPTCANGNDNLKKNGRHNHFKETSTKLFLSF